MSENECDCQQIKNIITKEATTYGFQRFEFKGT